jgi:hypothetical protein
VHNLFGFVWRIPRPLYVKDNLPLLLMNRRLLVVVVHSYLIVGKKLLRQYVASEAQFKEIHRE